VLKSSLIPAGQVLKSLKKVNFSESHVGEDFVLDFRCDEFFSAHNQPSKACRVPVLNSDKVAFVII